MTPQQARSFAERKATITAHQRRRDALSSVVDSTCLTDSRTHNRASTFTQTSGGHFSTNGFLIVALRLAHLLTVFVLLCMLAVPCAHAWQQDESAVKTAYLFKLGNYVRWPSKDPPKAFVLGIYGELPTAETLKPFAAAKINGVPVTVIRIDSIEKAPPCQMIFVGGETDADRDRLREAVKRYQKQNVLIVSDTRHSIEDGASIYLTRVDDNIKFELSVPAATSAGLTFDSRLQKIAYNVHRTVVAKE